ncbi:MAG: peptide ABC transporter substrate-binding protein [bacterium]|nr:peptide ABC transporter substrate-binding protein [bacterium]
MIDRSTKLRWRRRVRRRQQQIEGIGSQTEENLDKHFFRRIGRLYEIRRFILSWLLLLVALIGAVVVQTRALGDYFLQEVPAPGGIFSEAVLGSYTNANPIFASNDVDTTVSRLIFSGLLTYDKSNELVGDLAKEWSVDKTGKLYTLKLREDVLWHDGKEFTSQDVVYTYRAIQNPDTRSPYFSSWQGIKVEAPDDKTVTFLLPNILASFPHSLVSGILPSHLLGTTTPAGLRGSLFNTVEPIGTGPFRWNDVEVYGDTAENREQRIALSAYGDYHRGRPKLSEFIVRAFLEEKTLTESFNTGELNAVAGALSMPVVSDQTEEISIPLTGGVMVFLRTTQEILKDVKVRQALSMATDKKDLVQKLDFKSTPIDGPFLKEHVGYNPKIVQYSSNVMRANELLDGAGWKVGAGGLREKAGKRLTLNLYTLSSAEYATVASQLQKHWRQVGVDLQINSIAQRELQSVIDERNYDALVYGIVMGTDADQFAYWHSSQADARSQRRLNFSDYSSKTSDSALVAGRTRVDPALRAAKYLPFLQSWREDAPAIGLYRPRFVYITHGPVYNLNKDSLNIPIDRFNNVEEWMIRTTRAAANKK